MCGSQAFIALVPVHGAYFAVFFEVLESVNHAESFINRTSEREVVDDGMMNDAFLIHEEETTEGDLFPFNINVTIFVFYIVSGKDAEVFRDGLVCVGDDRVGDALDTALIAGCIKPRPVALLRICGATDNGNITVFEFLQLVLECNKLRRADKSEVLRIKEEHNVLLAPVLIEAEVLNDFSSVDNSGCRE